MSLDERTNESTLAAVAAMLGVSDADSLTKLRVESLRRRTQRELQEIARRLELSGVAKLNKDALATRVYQALLAKAKAKAEAEPSSSASANPAASRGREPAPPEAPAAPSSSQSPSTNGVATTEGEHVPIKMTHKFEVGEHAAPPQEEPRTIPWSYGQDRVTALPVDPERLFVYWEVTDEAIHRTRPQLGQAGATAWLELRVYDVTGRIFDGSNAHGYFDHKVERHERQWFFAINKPTSETLVEIGLKSHEGYFVKIARSGRVDFPPREPREWRTPEWMTVRAGEVRLEAGGGGPGASHAQHGGHAPGGGPGGGFDPVPLWQMRAPGEGVLRFPHGGGHERIEWEEVWSEAGGRAGGHRTFSWESPMMVTSWESGPYTYPVEVPPPVTEMHEGPVRVQRIAGRTHVVYGPWQVVIRGLGAHFSREVVAQWQIERSWVTEEGHEVRGVRTVASAGGSSELMAMGASERHWRGASEVRLGGASEIYYMGASERRMLGASETLYAGASEYRARGASERRFLGASERRFLGASERRLGGASELSYAGASEGRLGGASELRYASEGRLGGASEGRLAGGEPPPQAEGNGPSAYPQPPHTNG